MSRHTVCLAAAAALLSSTAVVFADIPPLKPGTKAPNFTTRTIDGKRLTLTSLRGHVVILDFWATWCGPCRMSTPTLVDLDDKFSKRGLRVIGMSIDDADSRADIRPFKKAYNVHYTLTYAPSVNIPLALTYHDDFDPNTGEQFDHPIPPCMFVIDKKGRVRWSQIGFYDGEEQELTPLIKKLLEEKA